MTGCKRTRYDIPPVHEKLAKVTVRIFLMARETTQSVISMISFQSVDVNIYTHKCCAAKNESISSISVLYK